MTTEEIMSRYDREIGARVRLRRKEVGLSQTQLGQALGVSFQQVQKYERGTNRISSSSLIVIADRLETTPAQLIGGITPDAVAAPGTDLVHRLLDLPAGMEIVKALLALPSEDKSRLADLAGRLAERAKAEDPTAYAKAA